MTKPPDLEALARRYVTLWQDQLAMVAADPELADGMTRMLRLMSGGLAAANGFWPGFWPAKPPVNEGTADDPARAAAEPGANAPGTAAIATAPFGGRFDVAQLQARIAVLEQRIAGLEARTPKPRRGARKRPRRHGAG